MPRNKQRTNPLISHALDYKRKMGMPAVLCPACQEWLQTLTKVHVETKHGMTQEEFCFKYPQVCDIFFWGDLSTQASRAKFSKWRKLAESKKGPPSGGPVE